MIAARFAVAAFVSLSLHLWLFHQEILSSLPEISLRSYPVSMELQLSAPSVAVPRVVPKIPEPPKTVPVVPDAVKPKPEPQPTPSVKSSAPPAPTERGTPQPRPLPGQKPPAYPLAAQYRHIEGTTLLEVEVLPDGRPGSVKVVKSSGSDLLDKAAVAGVRDWRFEPARENDRAVPSKFQIPIVFELKE